MAHYRIDLGVGNRKPVYIDGVRTPFVKSFGVFEDCDALELFSRVTQELIRKSAFDPHLIDEILCGVVIPQTKNANVARDTIINCKLPLSIHGVTLNRACTSSMQTVADASRSITAGQARLILAGGVEVLSDVPIVYSKEARKFLVKLSKMKTAAAKLKMLAQISLPAWLPKSPALAEPLTGLTMGESAEIMAVKNSISRKEQDVFAEASHKKAAAAQDKGYFAEEIVPIWPSPKFNPAVSADNLIRKDTSLEALAALNPVFDWKFGTITAGNASPLTDGAALSLIADEEFAKSIGLVPKMRILDTVMVAVDPFDQLLIGPAIAIPILLKRNKLEIANIDLFEVHEAFAAQVLSCLKSMESKEFNQKYFGSAQAFGSIPLEKLNVNGGATAIGHPFGATGSRLINSMSNELHRRQKTLGVIAICAAGGMAGAMLVERI